MGITRVAGLGSVRFILQQRQRFLQIESGRHVAKFQTQLDHGESYLRLNAHDHGPRSAEAYHLRQIADCSRRERIHHIENRNVDNDALGAIPANVRGQIVPQLEQNEKERLYAGWQKAVDRTRDWEPHEQSPR